MKKDRYKPSFFSRSEHDHPVGGPSSRVVRGSMGRTILIVDDNRFIVEGLHAILRRRGFDTVSALGGIEALELLSRSTTDLVLLDLSMEPIDGWETLRRMRSNPNLAEVPVIVFSARKTLPGEAARNTLGISEILQKPINTSRLLEVINRVLGAEAPAPAPVRGEPEPRGVEEEARPAAVEEIAGPAPVEEEVQPEGGQVVSTAEPYQEKSGEEPKKKLLEARLHEYHIIIGFEKHMSD